MQLAMPPRVLLRVRSFERSNLLCLGGLSSCHSLQLSAQLTHVGRLLGLHAKGNMCETGLLRSGAQIVAASHLALDLPALPLTLL